MERKLYLNPSQQLKSKIRQHTFSMRYQDLVLVWGGFEPRVKVIGTKFTYTYEQSSYFGKRSKDIKKISSGVFRQSSIDSIINLVKGLKDSTIFKSNACIMSGGIDFLTIANGNDTTQFELMNTFDSTALKIVIIINEYLPANKKLSTHEKFAQEDQDCWKYLHDAMEKNKSKTDSTKKAAHE